MIQLGARKGFTDAISVFQSSRDLGEKSFVPTGQLFLSSDLDTSRQLSHLKKSPPEYLPLSAILLQAHSAGLPFFGLGATSSFTPVQTAESPLPFATIGSGAKSRALYSDVLGYNLGVR